MIDGCSYLAGRPKADCFSELVWSLMSEFKAWDDLTGCSYNSRASLLMHDLLLSRLIFIGSSVCLLDLHGLFLSLSGVRGVSIGLI